MMVFFVITILLLGAVLFTLNHQLSRDGKGGEDALIIEGIDRKPTALVTGATGKIATELVRFLDKKGYRLILHGRDENKLKILAEQLNNPQLVIADLNKAEDRAKVMQLIIERTPELVINNAAISPRGPALQTSLDWLNLAIEVNCVALTSITLTAVKAMQAKQCHGIVLNFSSFGAKAAPMPNLAVYSSTKSFISNFSIALDFELKDTGIRVLATHPGKVATRIGRDEKNFDVVSIQNAVHEIYGQIERRQADYTFGRTYRVLGRAINSLPQNIKMWFYGRPRSGEQPDLGQPK